MKANSIRNLNMRQKCARLMIDTLHEGKRILNIDETWVGQTNYSRSTWQSSEYHPSEALFPVTPRISMIVAMDNCGDIYLSLMQANSNSDTFCLFLSHLIEELDRDRPNWKRDTVMQLDGARYHTTPQVKALLKK